jgi:hypothetical protein
MSASPTVKKGCGDVPACISIQSGYRLYKPIAMGKRLLWGVSLSLLLLGQFVAFGLRSRAAQMGQVQLAEVKAFLYADGGYFQPVTSGFTSNFDTNGYGSFGWDYNNASTGALQNARLIIFLDADLDRATTTFFNEYGTLINLSLPPGASAGAVAATGWEIDEPGFLTGDLAQHLLTGVLDQTNSLPAGAPDDVALALSFPLGTLPANAFVRIQGFISPTDIGGLRQTDADSNTTLYFNGFVIQNNAPAIIPQPVARQQGSPATNATIAMVSDDSTPAGNLIVTATTIPAGISITDIANNNGSITATIAAACNAAIGANTVVLTVTDGNNQTATANLIVNITANTPPTLGNYAATSVQTGANATIAPSFAPADNGTISSLNVSIFPLSLAGAVSINPITGVVNLNNVAPAGRYTVTVTATDNCSAITTRAFPLTVNQSNPGPTPTPSTNIGPGLTYPEISEVSDQKAGSVLFYNLYSSNAASPNTQNTRLALTNIHPTANIAVHLFFVDGQTCSIADAIICLTKNQTASFLASDLDPGTTGYLVAIAVDERGCPTNFNYLIGDEYIKLGSGHAANLGAEAFAALVTAPATCDDTSSTAVLRLDGVNYNRAPRVLAASSIPARADGNDTLLVINRVGGNLAIGADTLGAITGLLYDDAERSFSFAFNPGQCQFRAALNNNSPRTTPRLEQIIPAGRSGWLRLWQASDAGLLGAIINFNPNAGAHAAAFNQGRNLHKLTLTTTASLVVPIFPPGCRD